MTAAQTSKPPVIGDLAKPGQRQRLEIWCCNRECQRHTFLSPEEAIERLGANTTFPEAAHKLVCSACGARGSGGSRLITCRPSMEDFYANMAEQSGRPTPTPFNEGDYAKTVSDGAPRHPTRRHKRRGRGGW